MKQSVKKFFLLGLGIAAAGVAAGMAYKNRAKIKKAANELVQKGKLVKEDGEDLVKELGLALERMEKKAIKSIKKKSKKN